MTAYFVSCGDHPDEKKEIKKKKKKRKKEINLFPKPEEMQSYNQFCLFCSFLTHKVTPSWQGLDAAPEMRGSPWCPSIEEDN